MRSKFPSELLQHRGAGIQGREQLAALSTCTETWQLS